MTTSVGRRRICRRVASDGAKPKPENGRSSLFGLAAACVGVVTLSASTDVRGQAAAPQPQTTPAQTQAAQDQSTPVRPRSIPPGMVLYDHPILQNGRFVLWHGAWRDRARAREKEKPAVANQSQTVAAPTPQPPHAHDIILLADPDDACATRMAGELAAALHIDGGAARVLAGRVSASALGAAVQSDSANLAIASLDTLVADTQATVGWRERAPFIARLSGEPIEIIASRDILDARQLAGRDVGYGPADSAEASSATILFSALGVAPRPNYAPLAAQLADLSSGKLAAVVAIDGRCSKAVAGFGADRRFHEIAVHWSSTLKALYAPARLTAKDRPNLIDAEEKVDAVAASHILLALDALPDTPRAATAAALTKSLFDGFDRLLEPDRDDAWRTVNLAASAPWPRLKAAQAWIDDASPAANSSLEAFRSVARGAAANPDGPAPQDSDRLFDSLMRWRGTAQ